MKMFRIRSTMALFAAVAALFAAMSASAALLATNDFEEAAVADLTGFTAEGDEALSDIIGITAYDSDKPSGAYTTEPWPYAAANFGSQYLSVDSGTNMVWRLFADSSSKMYFDSYVKFTPTSGDVEYPDASKFVIFLDAATSNLCVISGTDENTTTPVTNRLNATVLPESWGRITVCATASDGVFAFQVRLNGALLATAGSTSTFYSLAAGSTVSQVGFKGTGAVDDMVVRTSDPFGAAALIDGETFATLEQAAAEAAAGDTILLESDSSESITLSAAGIVFNTNGKSYTGHVSAASGLGWTEENGVYTSSVNTAATWTGSVDNNWSNPDNWSSHGVPTAATTVTLPDGATIEATGTSALPVDSMIVNGAVKLTCTGDLANNWPSIGIKDSMSGSGTLTLERFGLTSSDADQVTVGCNICFDGKTEDSFLQSGSFVLNGSVTGTSKFQLLANTTFNGAVTIPDGAILSVGRSGTAATATFGNGSSLSGAGTVALWSNGYDARTYDGFASIKTKLTDSSWTGVCELSGTMAHIDFSYFGHSGSIVRANGLSGYLRFSQGSTTKIATGIKALDIGSSGFTMDNQFNDGQACNYEFDVALTGAGTITFGTRHANTGNVKSFYTINGDVSEFTGIVQFGSQTYRPVVVFKASGDVVPEPTDWGQIMITSNKSVNVCGAWNAVGGYWIRGTANVSSTGSLGCGAGTQKIAGDGVIRYVAASISGLSPELSSSDWTGTVELLARSGSGAVPLAKLGRSGSRIVVNGITGSDANSIYLSGGTAIDAVVELKGQLKLTNGSTGDNYTFAEVTGSGDMFLSATGSSGSPTFTYTFTKLDNYSGTINAVKTSDSKYAALAIGTVDVLEYVQGKRMVSLSNTCNLTTDLDDIAVSVNGVASTLKLFKADDGNLYVKAASVTTPSGTTCYSTVLAAIQAARETGAVVTVCDGTDASVGNFGEYGYVYDNGTWRVGAASVIHDEAGASTTNAYATFAAAISASAAGDTVMLLQNNDETGINDAGIDTTGKDFVFAENGFAFSGTFTGNGTITVAAVPSSTTWSSARFVANGWTGTFIMGWTVAQQTDSTAWVLDDYGISGSNVKVANEISAGYFKAAGSVAAPSVLPAVYFEANVTLNNGFQSSGSATTFAKVGMASGKTFTTRGRTNGDHTYYKFTMLEDFDGSFNIRGNDHLQFGTIVVNDSPVPEVAILKVTKTAVSGFSGGTVDGLADIRVKVVGDAAAVTMPMVFTTIGDVSGLYKAVAQFGGNYYATFQDAINARAAAGGSGDILVLDASAPVPEGYRIVDGKLVPNKKPAVLIFF